MRGWSRFQNLGKVKHPEFGLLVKDRNRSVLQRIKMYKPGEKVKNMIPACHGTKGGNIIIRRKFYSEDSFFS